MLLEGIFPAATTPFYPDGRVYTKKLEHNVERYSLTPVAGLVILGSTGEAVMLNDDDTRHVLRAAREAAAPDKVLIAGVARESVAETLRLAEYAAEQNYDAVLVRTPQFYAPQMDGAAMLTYYRALADRSPLPVVIYSIPKFTRYEIPVEVVAELAQHQNIVGIKDSSGSVERIAALVAATRNAPRRQADVTPVFTAYTTRMMLAQTMAQSNFVATEALAGPVAVAPPVQTKMTRRKEVGFQVLTGSAVQLYDSLQAGASGGVLAMAACAPQACQEIYTAWRENDPKLAAIKQQRMAVPSAVVLAKYGVPGIKHACDLNGYFGGRPRLPLLALDAQQQAEVANAMRDVKN
ncbi:MAG TPA: dihydrodipicolinate synthase family protein [Acidobacteriaceae bacterium]|nr:dihydrodipicolinate synthase family protein [Acidobacteriaceae bacterium]